MFGSFSAFVYGFIWIGGYIGDHYFGAKRTLFLGAIILMIAYALLGVADKHTVFCALALIVVGNTIFKANPSSLMSKLYKKVGPRLDGAMTIYYMAVNIGAIISMGITPIIAQNYGWGPAFLLCAVGLLLGVLSFYFFKKPMQNLATNAGKQPLSLSRLFGIIGGAVVATLVITNLLSHVWICDVIITVTVASGLAYFVKLALSLKGQERSLMLVTFVLIL